MVFRSPARRGGSSAQGTRPYAHSTRQAVCKLVTPNSQNGIFCSLCFQSLAHSFGNGISATLLFSQASALFTQNTGGEYTPPESPHVFKRLRTPTCLALSSLFEESDLCEGRLSLVFATHPKILSV